MDRERPPEKLLLNITLRIADDGALVFVPCSPPIQGEEFAPAAQVLEGDRLGNEFRAMNNELAGVRRAALMGDRKKAEQLLKEFEAAHPEPQWQKEAAKVRSQLDFLERQGGGMRRDKPPAER